MQYKCSHCNQLRESHDLLYMGSGKYVCVECKDDYVQRLNEGADIVPPTQYPRILASRWKRFFGAMVDAIVALCYIVPVSFALGYFDQLSQGSPLTLSQELVLSAVVWIFF